MSLRLMSAIISSQPVQSTTDERTTTSSSEKLLKQLLECVQECQKRYGGKTELATEFDSCVAGLCLTFEAVFSHGLRVKLKPSDEQKHPLNLKQVSEIVANSLNITNECPSFWPFVRKHLTKHEQERYAILKHIWTDIGCGRAWIRSTLNERSLERYCHILLSNSELLSIHYEDWALLRDQEKSSLLPTMAAGLASILFAISIDKPELNSGVSQRVDSFRSKVEPIIDAPIIEHKTKQKKKRRVARQFISFDDEDSLQLSTSVPSSSSSSISSESNNSVGGDSKSKQNLSQIMEEHRTLEEKAKAEEVKTTRKLPIENSGSRDKFPTQTPEALTPVSHTEIGILTPVSVETSPETSDDIVEISADISAVLTVVEAKNHEQLQKKQYRIEELLQENDSLKLQVKQYMSAIQMLEVPDEDEPNYKVEAKMFERKLVQVAEMHAELMDFNVRLQQTLSQKDVLLERLKSELEKLRGPISTDDVVGGDIVNVWIPSAFLTGSGSSSHHVYQVFLRVGNEEWNIYRRYAQFYALHTDLKKLDAEVATFDFPPKKSIGKKDSALVEERRKRLQIYLRKVIAHWPELSHCNSRFLLEQHLSFFKDQKDELKNKKSVFSPRRAATASNNNHYTGL